MAVTIDDGTFQKLFVGLVNLLDKYFVSEANLNNIISLINEQTAEKEEEQADGERVQQQDV